MFKPELLIREVINMPVKNEIGNIYGYLTEDASAGNSPANCTPKQNLFPQRVVLRPIGSQNGCAHLLVDVFLSSAYVGLVGLRVLNPAP